MRNSAWYHKLWLKKLSELPLKEDADAAWTGMKGLLDSQLPVAHHPTGNGTAGAENAVPVKTFVAKIISMVGYVLPAAAAIGVVTYVAVPSLFKPKLLQEKKKKQTHLVLDTAKNTLSAVGADSLKNVLPILRTINGDSLAGVRSAVSRPAIVMGTELTDKSKNDNGDEVKKISKTVTAGISEIQIPAGSTIGNVLVVKGTESVSIPTVRGGGLDAKLSAQKNLSTDTTSFANTNIKTASSKKTKIASVAKNKNNRPKVKGTKEITTPAYNFGLEAGWNGSTNKGFYAGVLGSYAIQKRLLLNAGVRLNTSSTLSGNYITKPSGVLEDTLSNYAVADTRKVTVFAVPLTLEYKLTNRLSVNGGAVINFQVKQSGVLTESKLMAGGQQATAYLDSVRHRAVDSTLTYTKVSKLNLGITGGVSIRFNQFYIEAKYLRLITPYKVTNSLGGYEKYNNTLQLGIRYQFKK